MKSWLRDRSIWNPVSLGCAAARRSRTPRARSASARAAAASPRWFRMRLIISYARYSPV